MLLGLANVLRLRIVVFSSIDSWPYFIIHPRTVPLDCPPILLAYLQSGPGHYSLAVKKEAVEQVSSPCDNVSRSNKGSKSHCRCGRGRNAANTRRLIVPKNQTIFLVALVFKVEYTAHLTASVIIVIISLQLIHAFL